MKSSDYLLLTIHRAENTNSSERVAEIVEFLLGIQQPVVFPMHPRTKNRLESDSALQSLSGRLFNSRHIRVIEPVSYLDMLALEDHARMVLTDSGGVQKEAYFLGVPCVTVRGETEWVETLAGGWNRLVEPSPKSLPVIESLWAKNGSSPTGQPDLVLFGGGNAAENIVNELLRN
jgi:UDP-N-acetylglucosamine 2-epimerase